MTCVLVLNHSELCLFVNEWPGPEVANSSIGGEQTDGQLSGVPPESPNQSSSSTTTSSSPSSSKPLQEDMEEEPGADDDVVIQPDSLMVEGGDDDLGSVCFGASFQGGRNVDEVNSLSSVFGCSDRYIQRLHKYFGVKKVERLLENISGCNVVTFYSGLGGAELSILNLYYALCRWAEMNNRPLPKKPIFVFACDIDPACQKILKSHKDLICWCGCGECKFDALTSSKTTNTFYYLLLID